MTVPLPSSGSTNWYTWAQDIHAKANAVSGVVPWLNVKDYGVVGDGRRAFDAAITSGQTALSSTAAAFDSGDVGKQVKVTGAGASGGLLTTTISSVSSGVATLAAAAGTTVTGAVATWGTDDTAALNSATSAVRMINGRRGGTLLVPANCRMLVSTPVNLYDSVSIVGTTWSMDEHYYSTSAFIAAAGFTGTAMLQQNADGNTVNDTGTPRPDRSWHHGLIRNLAFLGSGITGPHGLDPGWFGETSKVEQCQFQACNSGVYLNDTQASANVSTCSFFDNNYGINCDVIQSTVRVFGLSGDNNTSLMRVSGGVSANVTVMGVKAENYNTGTGDPVFDVTDLDGGSFTVIGGWCDTTSARNAVVKLSKTGATTNYPRVSLIGLGANTTYYSKMIDDVIGGTSSPVLLSGLTRGTYHWNVSMAIGGQGSLIASGSSSSSSTAVMIRLYAQTTAQTVTSGASPAVLLNTQETNDDSATFTSNLTTGAITVLKAGLYQAAWQVQYTGGSAGLRYASLRVNGTSKRSAGGLYSGEINVNQSTPIRLAANDVVSLGAYADGGTTTTIRSNDSADTAMSLVRLGS